MLNQDKVSKLSDVEQKVWGEDSSPSSKYVRPVYKESYGDR